MARRRQCAAAMGMTLEEVITAESRSIERLAEAIIAQADERKKPQTES